MDGKLGPSGPGEVTDARMAIEYIPAWLVLAYENPYPFAKLLPSLTTALDEQFERRGNGPASFREILHSLDASQKKVIAEVLSEIGRTQSGIDSESRDQIKRVSNFWLKQASG